MSAVMTSKQHEAVSLDTGSNKVPGESFSGREHPAEELSPLLLHISNSKEFDHRFPTRITAMLLGVEDPLKHRGEYFLSFPRGDYSPEGSFYPVMQALLNDHPTEEQRSALERLDYAMEEYIAMAHPIWEELAKVTSSMTLQSRRMLDGEGEEDQRRMRVFHEEVLDPIRDSLRDLGIAESLVKHFVFDVNFLILFGTSSSELRGPRGFLDSEKRHQRSVALNAFFQTEQLRFPEWTSRDLFALHVPVPGDNSLCMRDLFTTEEYRSLRHMNDVVMAEVENRHWNNPLLPYLARLTWGKLLGFAELTEEYNLEWALAAMEW